jgi:hypothetical protein
MLFLMSEKNAALCVTCKGQIIFYYVFRAQADWTWTHTSHKDTEHSTIEASITLDVVTLTDSLIR